MGRTRPSVKIPGFRGNTIRVNGIDLHYAVGGNPEGTPVLLWHGFLGTGYTWRRVATTLAARGLHVLVPDMRGFGDSDKPEGTDGYDARTLAQDFRALVRQIGFGGGRPLIVAAHDMGAPPALIWAADNPEEIAALLYVEEPVMLAEGLRKMLDYTPRAMERGPMWWWTLPLALGVPERLVVGREREFLTWFYDGATARREAIEDSAVDEYLRTFAGREGVLGAMGVYRAAFASIEQTEPLARKKVDVPVVALGGEKGLGAKVGDMVKLVAANVEAHVVPDCGHFVPEECPERIVEHVLYAAAKNTDGRRASDRSK